MAKAPRGKIGDRQPRWLTPAICIALAALIWIVFGQTRHHGFVNYDDGIYVHENPIVTSGLTRAGAVWAFTHSHAGNWHPLTTMSHMLDCQIFGLKPGPHHLVNVLLHAIGSVLLFLVLRQMTAGPGATDDIWRCAFVAALFAIHPLRVESVAWIAERKDVLSGVFFFLTLGAYAQYARKPSFLRYVTMSILYTLGLMSKPMLVTTPLVLLLLDYWPLKRLAGMRDFRPRLVEKIPLLLLSIASAAITLVAQRSSVATREHLPIMLRLGNAFVSYLTYIGQMLWPARLAVFYPYPRTALPLGQIVFAITVVIAISVLAILLRKRFPYVLTGWFWYLAMLVPVIGVVQVGLQGHADRYTYLPQIGLSLLLTWLIVDLVGAVRHRGIILATAATVVLLCLTMRATQQVSHWRDSETLWTRTLSATADNDVAHANLSDLYLREGRLDDAISHSQQALALRPGNADAHNNLALALRRKGDVNGAVAHWKKALELNPHQLNAEFHLAWILATSPDGSMRDGAKAVALMEDLLLHAGTRGAMVLRTLGAAYAEAGRFPEALPVAREALDLAMQQNDAALADDLRLNITSYEANLPLRDPSLSNVLPP
jgi:hypothetical protein